MGLLDTHLTQLGFWQNPNLNYKVFLIFTIFLGFLGFDHLYLRSPLTAVFKILSMLFGFGMIVYVYDIIQAIGNSEKIKTFGIGFPVLGNMGIGAGMFREEVPKNASNEFMKEHDKATKKSFSFIIYLFILLFTGLFGGDYFFLEDNMSGVKQLLFTLILFPISVLYTLFRVGKFIYDPEETVKKYPAYFGVPGASDTEGGSLLLKIRDLINPVCIIMKIKNFILGIISSFIMGAPCMKGGDIPDIAISSDVLSKVGLETPIYCGCLISLFFIILVGYVTMIIRKKQRDKDQDVNDVPHTPPSVRKQ